MRANRSINKVTYYLSRIFLYSLLVFMRFVPIFRSLPTKTARYNYHRYGRLILTTKINTLKYWLPTNTLNLIPYHNYRLES